MFKGADGQGVLVECPPLRHSHYVDIGGDARGQSHRGYGTNWGVGVMERWYGAERTDYTVFAEVYLDSVGA